MNPLLEFETRFNQSFSSQIQLLSITQQPLPNSFPEPVELTVAQYLTYIDDSEQRMRNIPIENLEAIPAFNLQQVSEDARAVVQALIDQDYVTAFTSLQEARSFVEGVAPELTLREHIIALNPDFDFEPDPPIGGGGGTPPVDDGTTGTAEEIQQAAEAYEAQLAALLWSADVSSFLSPVFTIDQATGNWVSTDAMGATVTGTTLAELYDSVGEAVAGGIATFIAAQQSTLDAIVAQGTTIANFEAAKTAAQAAAAQALEKLQEFGAQLTDQSNIDVLAIEAEATAQAAAVLDALTSRLSGLGDTLDDLVIGSRNSDPSFVVLPDGTAAGSGEGDWFYLSATADTFDGGLGADVLFGLGGADNLSGGADADHLFGGSGDDALSGGSENDMLVGGRGDDAIDGGTGDADMVAFDAPMGRYTLQLSADGSITAIDRSIAGDGTDTLRDVEMLSFTQGATIFEDGMLDLSIIQGITGLDETQIATFIELYIAYFNRAPDALGLYFWGSAFANGTSLEETASLFLDQNETRATYPPDATNLDFATQVYSNVLGRTPDQAGLVFWESQLDSAAVSRGEFILEVLRGAKTDPAPDATQEFIDLQLQDRAFLGDKTDIGTYFAVIKGLSNVDDAAAAMQLFVRGDDSSIQTAIAEIDRDFASADSAGSGELILQLVGVADDPFAVV